MLFAWGIAAYLHSMDLKDTFSYFPFSKSYQNGSKMRPGDLRSGVNNFFVNTIVTALQGSEWERLLERCGSVFFFFSKVFYMFDIVIRIGETAMFHLLSEESIFFPLPNECLLRLTRIRLF